MPFGVGGGINSLSQIEKLIHAGAEKVVICSEALQRPEFIKEASQEFGSSTIAVCMDVGKSFFGGTKLYSHSGSKAHAQELESFAKKMQEFGAGELIIQSIVQDGKMSGYDHAISISASKKISIPVTVLGGAGSMEDIKSLHEQHPFNGYAAGSLFVYQGKLRGVLINYPNQEIKVKSTMVSI
jgi:cyclase